MSDLVYGVSDFLAVLNQTLEVAYPYITIEGELADVRISKQRWAYFKLKDETGSLNCFGAVYMLPGPVEDGMVVRVTGSPKHHMQYGFSFNAQSMAVSGEGSLRKAFDLLQKKLTAEGLFAPERKRVLPTIPSSVGLITSKGSAAEADFLKITNERWGGLTIIRRDSLVQGVDAPVSLVTSIKDCNELPEPPDVLVIIRGGGSQDDLAAFNDERVVRAVAGSRVPTLVAIGHETDLSLAELAADQRASTPTNAAQLLVPDRNYIIGQAWGVIDQLGGNLSNELIANREARHIGLVTMQHRITQTLESHRQQLRATRVLLGSYDPRQVLQRGYALVRKAGKIARSVNDVHTNDKIALQFYDGTAEAQIVSKEA